MVLSLFDGAGEDPMVTVKYNGEQLGPPWVAVGGAAAKYRRDYWYEDYLQKPNATGMGKPYTVTFELRQGGTFRIFRNSSYARTKIQAGTFTMALSKGMAVEPTHAYMPQQDFWHADADKFSPWAYRRDEITYHLYGRLSYDPNTPDRVFRALIQDRTGTDALWDPMQAAGDIVPWIDTAHQFGPDQARLRPRARDRRRSGLLGTAGRPGFRGQLRALRQADPAQSSPQRPHGTPSR